MRTVGEVARLPIRLATDGSQVNHLIIIILIPIIIISARHNKHNRMHMHMIYIYMYLGSLQGLVFRRAQEARGLSELQHIRDGDHDNDNDNGKFELRSTKAIRS